MVEGVQQGPVLVETFSTATQRGFRLDFVLSAVCTGVCVVLVICVLAPYVGTQ